MARRFEGDETWRALLDWTKAQKASERLAAAILHSEGYEDIDPSHPLGGPDGGKDFLCKKDGLTIVGAVYFPRSQQTFRDIKAKFASDVKKVKRNNANGIVFVTNQELRLGERKKLEGIDKAVTVDLYHLERFTQVLNVPKNYGIRLEYLGIDVTKEEYIAFIANRDDEHYRRFTDLEARLKAVSDQLEKHIVGYATGSGSLAFFLPSVRPGTKVVVLSLWHDDSPYPVFDISGYFVNLDEPGSRFLFDFGTLHPGKAIVSALTLDMTGKDRLAINLFMNTRTTFVRQLCRFFQVNGEFVFAYRVQDLENEILQQEIPDRVPGFNPEDPDAVFR